MAKRTGKANRIGTCAICGREVDVNAQGFPVPHRIPSTTGGEDLWKCPGRTFPAEGVHDKPESDS